MRLHGFSSRIWLTVTGSCPGRTQETWSRIDPVLGFAKLSPTYAEWTAAATGYAPRIAGRKEPTERSHEGQCFLPISSMG